jgi:hypothetical protein
MYPLYLAWQYGTRPSAQAVTQTTPLPPPQTPPGGTKTASTVPFTLTGPLVVGGLVVGLLAVIAALTASTETGPEAHR